VNVEPLYGLRLTTPRLELRLGRRDELVEVHELAREGIHPPDEMPFENPWTDRSGDPDFVEKCVAFHESALRDWRPERWSFNPLVFLDGRPVGSQGMRAEDFPTRREVDTGSWLGRVFQGRGIGTEMRTALLELAFRALGAEAALSGSVFGNESSKRVSEKLGYAIVGTSTIAPRSEPVAKYDFRLERDDWRPPFPVEIEGVEACLELFGAKGGLDETSAVRPEAR
jgi:RimJ/RimL family protein N-acetyltransferase